MLRVVLLIIGGLMNLLGAFMIFYSFSAQNFLFMDYTPLYEANANLKRLSYQSGLFAGCGKLETETTVKCYNELNFLRAVSDKDEQYEKNKFFLEVEDTFKDNSNGYEEIEIAYSKNDQIFVLFHKLFKTPNDTATEITTKVLFMVAIAIYMVGAIILLPLYFCVKNMGDFSAALLLLGWFFHVAGASIVTYLIIQMDPERDYSQFGGSFTCVWASVIIQLVSIVIIFCSASAYMREKI